MKKITYFIIAVVLIIIAIMTYRSLVTPETTTGASVYEAKMADGKQELVLSWGRITYNPDTIKVKAGIPLELSMDLKRLTGCYQTLVIPGIRFYKYFDSGNNHAEVIFDKPGKYPFTCGMNMGRGMFIVE